MSPAALGHNAPPLRAMPVVDLALDAIVGVDACNARRAPVAESDIDALAADIAARGQIQPLVVRLHADGYHVLIGGLRWRALLRQASAAGPVACCLFEGDDEAAAQYSLAAEINTRPLHPLDEADAVAEHALARGAPSAAASFDRAPRWVEERIKLSRLPEVARAAWLDGRIGLAQARALTNGAPARIEALFADSNAAAVLSDPALIRRALTPRGVSSKAPAALFVGRDAYVAAGGAIHADLFAEDEVWLDAELLRQLERRGIARIQDEICEAEGWGVQLFEAGDVGKCVQPDFTPDELAELDLLSRQLKLFEIDGATAEARDAEIQRRAVLRAVSVSDRARYGLHVGLDMDGRAHVTRGVIVGGRDHSPPTPADAAPSVSGNSEGAAPLPAPIARPPRPALRVVEEPAVLPRDMRRHFEKAATRAAASLIAGHSNLEVLRLALAALVTADPFFRLKCSQGPGAHYSPLTRELARLPFLGAWARAREASDSEAFHAFREVVAGSLDLRDRNDSAFFVDGLAIALGFDRAKIAWSVAYEEAFADAPRPVSLAAIRDCAGPAGASERVWMNDAALAKEAALLARAKGWLPEFLRGTP